MFPAERGLCCAAGSRVLRKIDNPPITRKQAALLGARHMSHYSRIINSLLSFAAIGTTPTQGRGGRGIRCREFPGVFSLHGRTYHLWVPPSNPGPARGHRRFNSVPSIMLLDRVDSVSDRRAAMTLLTQWRAYLHAHHPLAKSLAHVGDRQQSGRAVPLAVSIAPSTAVSAPMEVALVYPDSAAGPPARFAVPFPLRSDPASRHPNTFVSAASALYDVLFYPLYHNFGRGGFNMPATYSRVARDSSILASAASRVCCARATREGSRGHAFTLLQWAKANLYQNSRLHALGRLTQEWALDQFSRFEHDNLEHIKAQARNAFYAPMHAVRRGVEAIKDWRRRVRLSSSFVGCKRYLDGKVADGMAIVQVREQAWAPAGVRRRPPLPRSPPAVARQAHVLHHVHGQPRLARDPAAALRAAPGPRHPRRRRHAHLQAQAARAAQGPARGEVPRRRLRVHLLRHRVPEARPPPRPQ